MTDLRIGPNDEIEGVQTWFGVSFRARAVVLTTGTFMNGRIWVGRRSMAAGRAGEAPSEGLTEALVKLGFEGKIPLTHTRTHTRTRTRTLTLTLTLTTSPSSVPADRLKTGTPARVDKRTIDFSVLEAQPGEDPERFFSFDPAYHVPREMLSCHITRTTAETHRLIQDNLAETPKYGGWMPAHGPRYCPSIEDKIVRFANKDSHQIFLEPEGR